MKKKIVSWDFDWTLFDVEKKCLIPNTYKIFKDMKDKGEFMPIITTYRHKSEIGEIEKYLGKDIPIFATNRESKVEFLLSMPMSERIISHFDDDYATCQEFLKYSHIKPVYIDWKGFSINNMDTIDLSFYAMTR